MCDKTWNQGQEITVDVYIEKIVVVAAGMLVRILTHAEKEKESETGEAVDEKEGSGKVRNCPAVIATKFF